MKCPQCAQDAPCLYNRRMIEELVVTRIERMLCRNCSNKVDHSKVEALGARHEVIYWAACSLHEGPQRLRERIQALFGDDMAALATTDAGVRAQIVEWFSGRCKTYRSLKGLVQILAAKVVRLR